MKKYEVTLCTKLNGHIKLELTEEEAELIIKLSESLKDNKTIWDGSIEITEAYSHLDKFIKDNETKNKKKLDYGMIIHCATEEEFHRIGKMINKFYPCNSNPECYFYDFSEDFCFDTLDSDRWRCGSLKWYKGCGYEITESTEIE